MGKYSVFISDGHTAATYEFDRNLGQGFWGKENKLGSVCATM